MKFLLGTKQGMTQIYDEEGRIHAVTKIAAGPCVITQVKTADTDGYQSVQLGFGEKKEKRMTKPEKGHLMGLKNFRHLREFRVKDVKEFERGKELRVDVFKDEKQVDVTGVSIGRGFQGVVKRHGFHGQDATHGHKDQERMPGSIGDGGAQVVKPGKRMGGRMGGDRVTVKNLNIIKVDLEQNLLFVEGAVPGSRNGLLLIHSA